MVFCAKIWKISNDAKASWWQNLEGAPLMQPWSILKRSGVVAECECVTLCNPTKYPRVYSHSMENQHPKIRAVSVQRLHRARSLWWEFALSHAQSEAKRWDFDGRASWAPSNCTGFVSGKKMTGNSQEILNILPIITEVSRKSPRKPILGVLQSSWISAWKTHWEDWRSRESPEHYENPAGPRNFLNKTSSTAGLILISGAPPYLVWKHVKAMMASQKVFESLFCW